MAIPSWIRKLFDVPPVRAFRKTRKRHLKVESLEDRIAPAVLQYSADVDVNLTLRLSGQNLQIVETTDSTVLVSETLSTITGVLIDGNGHNVDLTISDTVNTVTGNVQFIGGDGTNRLIGQNKNTSWKIDTADAGTAEVSTGLVINFDGVEILRGGSAVDSLIGPNVNADWELQDDGAGTLSTSSGESTRSHRGRRCRRGLWPGVQDRDRRDLDVPRSERWQSGSGD